jgi:hypothetical protein
MMRSRRASFFTFILAILVQSTGRAQHEPDRGRLNDAPLSYGDTVFMSERFDSLRIPAGWRVDQIVGSTATWTFVDSGSNPPVNPVAGTGQAKFGSFNSTTGNQARLTSRAINLSRGVNPFLQFYMYRDNGIPSSLDSIYLEASTADSVNGPWTILRGLQRTRSSSAWLLESISLLQYTGQRKLFLSLRGVSKSGNNMFVDEFWIYDTVFHSEGFNGSGIPVGWNVGQIVGPNATWAVVGMGSNPPILPYAGAGQAKFNSFDAGVGEQARLTSRIINLTRGDSPYLQFYMYHENEFSSSLDSIYVEISTADSVTGPWTILRGLQRLAPTPGWQRETIPLSTYNGLSRVFFGLRGVSKFGNNIYVDEFSIGEISFHDIGAVGLLAGQTPTDDNHGAGSSAFNQSRSGKSAQSPARLEPLVILDRTQPVALGVIVRNFGTFEEDFYQVGWKVDGANQQPVINAFILLPNGTDTLQLPWSSPIPGTHVITAWTLLPEDSNHTNDTTRITVLIPDSSVIFSETFNGTTFPPAGWVTINRDGGPLPPWFQGTSVSPITPFEGAGFAADNFQRANGSYLDDYLISPPVQGVGSPTQYDSLVFWCRSMNYPPPNLNYPDSLMILLSTTGTDTSNFATLVDYFSVPKTDWTRRAYKLTGRVSSNSTIRVAFRYLLYAVQPTSGSGDFIGIDAVQFTRGMPASVEHDLGVPTTFTLEQNYPNPFNPTTTIEYGLPNAANVNLAIYNILGQEVATLARGHQSSGNYRAVWDGRSAAGVQASTGVYFYRLEAKSTKSTFTNLKKMLLIK